MINGKKIVYVAHPISGDVDANLADLARILRVINLDNHPVFNQIPDEQFDFSDIIPIAPYYGDIIALDDSKPLERKKGMENGYNLIFTGVFDELWLTGSHISLGMQEEVQVFKLLGKTIVDYTNKI